MHITYITTFNLHSLLMIVIEAPSPDTRRKESLEKHSYIVYVLFNYRKLITSQGKSWMRIYNALERPY